MTVKCRRLHLLAVEIRCLHGDVTHRIGIRLMPERIVAEHGSKAYGRLAVIAQWRTRPKLLFTLTPLVPTLM